MIKHKSYAYADKVVKNEIPAPKYVIKQCEEFLKVCDGKDERYFLDEQKLSQIIACNAPRL